VLFKLRSKKWESLKKREKKLKVLYFELVKEKWNE